tara:strand:- start:246 stop:437 length:192 start_codon:yes stop_codon:yes gene_type:complete
VKRDEQLCALCHNHSYTLFEEEALFFDDTLSSSSPFVVVVVVPFLGERIARRASSIGEKKGGR